MILDGKKLRDKILDNLADKISKLSVKPTLAVILAGDDPASRIYVIMRIETVLSLSFFIIYVK